jgi:hypothetical protein
VSWFADETEQMHRTNCKYCGTGTEWDADVDRVFAWKAEHEATCPWIAGVKAAHGAGA